MTGTEVPTSGTRRDHTHPGSPETVDGVEGTRAEGLESWSFRVGRTRSLPKSHL